MNIPIIQSIPKQTSPPEAICDRPSVEDWRASLVNVICRVGAFVGLVPLVLAVYLALPQQNYISIFIYLLLYGFCVAFMVAKSIHYRVRGALLIVATLAVGATELVNDSMAADGALYLSACAAITGLIFGVRWGLSVILVSITLFSGAALLWLADPSNPPGDISGMPIEPINWVAAGVNFLLLASVVTFAVDYMQRRLERSLGESRSLIRQLREEEACRKQADASRQLLENQMIRNQRMEALGQFAGGLAHDFNNLLQVILAHAEFAESTTKAELSKTTPGKPGTDLSNELAQIIHAVNSGRSLVRQLLAFSRQQDLEYSDMNLDKVVGELVEMIRRVIGRNITLTFVAGHDDGVVWVDRGQLEQILINLCVNARDAMQGNGTLRIETDNVIRPLGEFVRLTVIDDGAGMAPEIVEHIFEPFFTTKKMGEGTGLGLSTTFGIVQQHGGFIEVESTPGVGTSFQVYLPQSARTEARVEAIKP